MKIRYKKASDFQNPVRVNYDVYVNAVYVGVVYKWRHLGLNLRGWRAATPRRAPVYTLNNFAASRDEAARALAAKAVKL